MYSGPPPSPRQMSEDLYQYGFPPYGDRLTPEYCVSHWTVQCRWGSGT